MRTSRILLILLGSMRVAASARADPPKPAEWTATADLSYVKTGGNAESSTLGFKTALLISFTHQSETIPDPATNDSFVGLRFTGDFASKFGPEARNTFKSLLALDENLQATDDFRLTWLNTLAVAMNSRLALQVGFLAAFDNLPALVEVPRYLSVSGDVPTDRGRGASSCPSRSGTRSSRSRS
jgi:hypothetical protein